MKSSQHKDNYHITSRTKNQQWFSEPMNRVWQQSLISFEIAYSKFPVELISFVLMQNHYHMLVRAKRCDLDGFITVFNDSFKLVNEGYHCSIIESSRYLYHSYKYVYQNPLRSTSVKFCENYPYSSLFYLVRGIEFVIPIRDYFGFKDEFAMRWLNDLMPQKETELVRWKIKKSSVIRK